MLKKLVLALLFFNIFFNSYAMEPNLDDEAVAQIYYETEAKKLLFQLKQVKKEIDKFEAEKLQTIISKLHISKQGSIGSILKVLGKKLVSDAEILPLFVSMIAQMQQV
ncbi:hypothetical protein M1446_00690 [Candidatus Dependentiae bacterium]|nr:hypothetical protein [Candidatus Dependentiae bacterium]